MDDVKSYLDTMEIALDIAAGDVEMVEMEGKAVRRIRSAEGARRYGAPIGSIIRADGTVVKPDAKPDASVPNNPRAAKKPSGSAPKKDEATKEPVRSKLSSMKIGKKKNVDGWEVYPVRASDGTEYAITNDGNGWYPYEGEHDYLSDNYFDSPQKAAEWLENHHGDKKASAGGKPAAKKRKEK